ncbi:cytochrome b/b6 domain-containing protein [Paracoccaceae bacterium Fryx2]|nr:cytochrome b/b6 domain-containing protein [Paracoccaceae bacterium Fryx2]
MIKVWAPALRVFQWGLVAVFALAWVAADETSTVHEYAGHVAWALIGFRLVWGLIGPHYARFNQFQKRPGAVAGYLGQMATGREQRFVGHNPAGAAMIVVILATMAATAGTGWLMAEPARIALLPEMPAFVAPAFADDDEGEGREAGGMIEETHDVLANLMLLLIALHIGGVVLASLRHRENLARAMITGAKRAPGPGDIA